MTILDQLAVQILREFGISSFFPGISGFAICFNGKSGSESLLIIAPLIKIDSE